MKTLIQLLLCVCACDRLGPRVDDVHVDAPPAPVADAPPGARQVLPAGSDVPHVSGNPALVAEIRLNDGLSDSQLAANGGVLARTVGKANGANVMFWNFGAANVSGNFATVSPVYVLVDGAGLPIDHLELVDSIPGDPRYSQIRRIMHVPITATYAGELVTSIPALAEALELGIVGEPVSAGTWKNMPVVPHDTKLELGGTAAPLDPIEVYAEGHRVTAFVVGGVHPLRNNSVPIGQESRLVSGVATGTPPVMPTTADATPVFQWGIPPTPLPATLAYTPLAAQVDVRLATNVAPTTIMGDAQLFRRNPVATGSINGFLVDAVASYTITTTVTNRQIQFVEGQP